MSHVTELVSGSFLKFDVLNNSKIWIFKEIFQFKRCSEFSIYEIDDVTPRVANSEIFKEILLLSY